MQPIIEFRKILFERVSDQLSKPGSECFVDYKFIESDPSLLGAFQTLPKTDQSHIIRSGIRIINPAHEFKVTNTHLEAIANTLIYAIANIFMPIGDEDALEWIMKIQTSFPNLIESLRKLVNAFNLDEIEDSNQRAAKAEEFIRYLASKEFREGTDEYLGLNGFIRNYASKQNNLKTQQIARMSNLKIASLIRASDIQVQSAFKRPEVICYDPSSETYSAETPNSLDDNGDAYTRNCYDRMDGLPANSLRSTYANSEEILFESGRSACFTAMKETDKDYRLNKTILALESYITSFLQREIELNAEKYVDNPEVQINIFSLLSLILKNVSSLDNKQEQNEQIDKLLSAILLHVSGKTFEIKVDDYTYNIKVNVELFSLGTNQIGQLSPEKRDRINARFLNQQIHEIYLKLKNDVNYSDASVSSLMTIISELGKDVRDTDELIALRSTLEKIDDPLIQSEQEKAFFENDSVSFARKMQFWQTQENVFKKHLDLIRNSLGNNPNQKSDLYKIYLIMQDIYTVFYNYNHHYYNNLNSRGAALQAVRNTFSAKNTVPAQFVHRALMRLSKTLDHHTVVMCSDAKDRTGEVLITEQAEEQFKQTYGYYPRFDNSADLKHYNNIVTKDVSRSAAFYTSAYACRFDPLLQSGAYGLEVALTNDRPYVTSELRVLATSGKKIHPSGALKLKAEQKAREWLSVNNAAEKTIKNDDIEESTSFFSSLSLVSRVSSLFKKAVIGLSILGTFASMLFLGNANANSDLSPNLQRSTTLSVQVQREANQSSPNINTNSNRGAGTVKSELASIFHSVDSSASGATQKESSSPLQKNTFDSDSESWQYSDSEEDDEFYSDDNSSVADSALYQQEANIINGSATFTRPRSNSDPRIVPASTLSPTVGSMQKSAKKIADDDHYQPSTSPNTPHSTKPSKPFSDKNSAPNSKPKRDEVVADNRDDKLSQGEESGDDSENIENAKYRLKQKAPKDHSIFSRRHSGFLSNGLVDALHGEQENAIAEKIRAEDADNTFRI